MSTISWIVLGILAILLVTIVLAYILVIEVEKKTGKPIGDLWVDPSETMPGEGVYTVFTKDPKAFTDGQSIILRVRVRKENRRHNGESK